MGFWGSALYSNDTTSDVRGMYKDFLSDQLSNEEAYTMTVEGCQEIIESDEEPLFWFALAETQWRTGRLRLDVKEKALEWIEKKGCLDFWEENPKEAVGWEKTLQKLKETLEKPMPKEKRFIKLDQNPWNLNDVYAYQLNGEYAERTGLAGKYMLLQKIGVYDCGGKIAKPRMLLQAIDHVFDELPKLEDINNYRILPMEDLSLKDHLRPLAMNGYIFILKKSEYPVKYLTFLGNTPGPINKHFAYEMIGWPIDFHLCHRYLYWQGKEYDEIEEGIYDCRIDYDGHISSSKLRHEDYIKLKEEIAKSRPPISIHFSSNDKNIEETLSYEDSRTLDKILFARGNKSSRAVKPSYRFSENVYIKCASLIFYVCCDASPVLKDGDRYLQISEENRAIINQLFEKYGGFFPC